MTSRSPIKKPKQFFNLETLESRTFLSATPVLNLLETGPANVTAGTDATYTFTTTNAGKTTANIINYTPPVGYPSGCTQVTFALTSGPAILKPGQSQVYTLVLKVDPSVASGTVLNFPVEVTTPKGNSSLTGNVTVNTPVISSADLNLVVTGPAEVTRGTTATFFIGTLNAGPSTETTGLYTPPSGFPAGWTQLSYTLIQGPGFALAPGDQDVYALVMSIAPSAALGTFSFPAILTGGITDPDATNNSGTVGTTVVTQTVQPVSIALTSSTFNSTSTLGEAVTLSAAITSVAAGTPVPTGTVTFSSDGVVLGTEAVGTDGTATLPATSALTGGNHTIIASYSGDGTFVATTKSLTQVVTVPVPSTVVPIFGKISLPVAVVSGAKFKSSFPVGLTNNGAKQSGIFTVTLFANKTNSLDGNQVAITAPLQKHLTLLTDRHAVLGFHPNSLPATLPAGTYYILAEVTDALGLNNVVATTQTITTAAPFVSLAATVGAMNPATIKTNKTGSIVVSITNNGNIAATGPLVITLIPSADGVTPEAGVTLTTLSIPRANIKNGKTARYVVHLRDTALVPKGTFYPYVTVSLNAGANTASVLGTSPFTVL